MLQILIYRIAFSSGEGGPPKVVDEEVAIRMCDTLLYGLCLVAQGFFCNDTKFSKDVKPTKGRPPHPPLARSPFPAGEGL